MPRSPILCARKGVWDRARLRDMVDRLVFRHDPDAVRQRRKDAMDQRGVWTHELPDGTAELTSVMSAENVPVTSSKPRGLGRCAIRDEDGHLVTEYETPEGVTLPGDAETLEDTFRNKQAREDLDRLDPPPF